MLIPDLILLAVVLVLAAWRLFAPAGQPPARRYGLAALIGLATALVIATVFERILLVRLP